MYHPIVDESWHSSCATIRVLPEPPAPVTTAAVYRHPVRSPLSVRDITRHCHRFARIDASRRIAEFTARRAVPRRLWGREISRATRHKQGQHCFSMCPRAPDQGCDCADPQHPHIPVNILSARRQRSAPVGPTSVCHQLSIASHVPDGSPSDSYTIVPERFPRPPNNSRLNPASGDVPQLLAHARSGSQEQSHADLPILSRHRQDRVNPASSAALTKGHTRSIHVAFLKASTSLTGRSHAAPQAHICRLPRRIRSPARQTYQENPLA